MATIELPESTANLLAERAKAEGLSLNAFLEVIAAQRAPKDGTLPKLTAEELDRLLDEEANTDSSYQGTYSRTDIYLDHD
jgi:hypothetical protein